jgi:hypothetical protein
MLNLEGQGRSELEDKVNLRWWHELPKKVPLDALIAKLMVTTSKGVVSQLGLGTKSGCKIHSGKCKLK